jgi:NADH:ubiquinone oxidoreductase subunit 6 (subunit J)
MVNISLLSLNKNPVMCVVNFIGVVGCFSILLIYGLNHDLLGLILILVYIGAISVIFLFIVMMLNIRIIETTSIFFGYLSISLFYVIIILMETSQFFTLTNFLEIKKFYNEPLYITLVTPELILFIFYNYQFLWLILITFILLVAMIGSILLTQKVVVRTKRQDMAEQSLLNGSQTLILKNLCIF